jgi:hypothetical protein
LQRPSGGLILHPRRITVDLSGTYKSPYVQRRPRIETGHVTDDIMIIMMIMGMIITCSRVILEKVILDQSTKKSPRNLCNRKVHYRVDKNLVLMRTLGRINEVHFVAL